MEGLEVTSPHKPSCSSPAESMRAPNCQGAGRPAVARLCQGPGVGEAHDRRVLLLPGSQAQRPTEYEPSQHNPGRGRRLLRLSGTRPRGDGR